MENKKYDYVSKYYSGFAAVRIGYKWGFIDENGKEICPIKYEFPDNKRLGTFLEGFAVVELDGKFGFVNKSGEEVCEIKYKSMSCFNEYGYAQITFPNTKFDRTYWIDTEGKEYFLYFDSNEMQPLN